MHAPTTWLAPPTVEFVGMPGAGKTTLAAKAIPMLSRCGLNVADYPGVWGWISERRKLQKLQWVLRDWRTSSELSLAMTRYLLNLRPLTWRNFSASLRRAVAVSHMHRYCAVHDCDVLFLDEDKLHYTCVLHGRAERSDDEAYDRLVRRLLRLERRHYVVVEIDAECALSRLLDRLPGHDFFNRDNTPAVRRMLLRYQARLPAITRAMRDLGRPVLVLDGRGRSEDNARRLLQWMDSTLTTEPRIPAFAD